MNRSWRSPSLGAVALLLGGMGLLAGCDGLAATQASEIPKGFRGEWNLHFEDCGSGRNDTRLRVDAEKIQFYESTAYVQAVERISPQEIRVDLRFSGEGDFWSRTYHYRLSNNRQALIDLSGESELRRYRCAQAG
ncbi:hypothetical protein [uncultured Abyssibacter sp.]|uniref:hypothetical protein n=1 Tax=uncultured Abyssibacter sp. TaxID=2320202 RepID=UPI0032B17025